MGTVFEGGTVEEDAVVVVNKEELVINTNNKENVLPRETMMQENMTIRWWFFRTS
jgi:hypothetical protein